MVKKLTSSNLLNVVVLFLVLLLINWGIFDYIQSQEKVFFELLLSSKLKYIVIFSILVVLDVYLVKVIFQQMRWHKMFRDLQKDP